MPRSAFSEWLKSYKTASSDVIKPPQEEHQTVGPALDGLPIEILENIFTNLLFCDLKNLRLLCRVFEAGANRFVFAIANAWIQRQSLESLVQLASTERLRGYVKTLVIDDASLTLRNYSLREFKYGIAKHDPRCTYKLEPGDIEADLSNKQLKILIHDHEDVLSRCLGNAGISSASIDQAYEEYFNLKKDHELMLAEHEDEVLLSEALAGFPNLKSVVFSHCRPENPRTVGSRVKILVGYGFDWTDEHIPFAVYLRALEIHDPGMVSELTISHAWDFGRSTFIAEQASSWRGLQLLAQITTLNIAVKPPLISQGHIGDVDHNTKMLLQAMPRLKTLRVYDDQLYHSMAFLNVLTSLSTNYLESIDLEHAFMFLEEFKAFLTTHKRTLKRIRLGRIDLFQATFKELFTFMRANLSLESLELSGYLVETLRIGRGYSSVPQEHKDMLESLDSREVQHEARKALSAFVTRQRVDYPSEIEDIVYRNDERGLVVIVGNCSSETGS